jgi:hypothetical protein
MQLTTAARSLAPTLLALLPWATGCATPIDISDLDVHRVSAPDADLARYRTFRWAELPSGFDKEFLAVIVPAIEKELVSRGLERQHADADLLLVLNAGRRTRLELSNWQTTGGSTSSREELELVEVEVGNVGLEMRDAGTERAVWRGQVSGLIRKDLDPETRSARAAMGAELLLGDFPDA